jgi:hypothetical protein
MVETVGIRQVMWLVMLEYAKNQILGVDTIVTSLKFKYFICILIICVTFESSQILKFLFELKSLLNSNINFNFNSNSVLIQSKRSISKLLQIVQSTSWQNFTFSETPIYFFQFISCFSIDGKD